MGLAGHSGTTRDTPATGRERCLSQSTAWTEGKTINPQRDKNPAPAHPRRPSALFHLNSGWSSSGVAGWSALSCLLNSAETSFSASSTTSVAKLINDIIQMGLSARTSKSGGCRNPIQNSKQLTGNSSCKVFLEQVSATLQKVQRGQQQPALSMGSKPAETKFT